MADTVLIATRNRGKMKEFEKLFGQQGLSVKSLLDIPELPDTDETGETFMENALLKAKEAAEALGIPAVADDSGLTVEALDGEPGVRSARYAGEHGNDAANNEKLLRELAARVGQPERMAGDSRPLVWSKASFVCAMVYYDPSTKEAVTAEGRCEGYIAAEAKGGNGFGYDPLLYLPSFDRTMAELEPDEKNQISHRAAAMKLLFEKLQNRIHS